MFPIETRVRNCRAKIRALIVAKCAPRETRKLDPAERQVDTLFPNHWDNGGWEDKWNNFSDLDYPPPPLRKP